MNYGKLIKTDIANGPGVRVSLFVSGCRRKCPGCFNPETWSFNYGEPYTTNTTIEILDALAPDYIDGLTVLGGEPLDVRNVIHVQPLLYVVKMKYPNKSIWVYTGHRFENISRRSIMDFIDVLVDGPFIEELKDLTLKFRGSSNQRIIDVQASRKSNRVILWEDNK